MTDDLDHDVRLLKEWLRGAWHFLSDPSSTRFERREIRNTMKEVDVALRTALNRISARETARRETDRVVAAVAPPALRILTLDV
jgi:hypothetical protein